MKENVDNGRSSESPESIIEWPELLINERLVEAL